MKTEEEKRKRKERLEKWKKLNPKKVKMYRDNWKEKRVGYLRKIILERDGYACQMCHMTEEEHFKKWGISITVHHKDGKGYYFKIKNNDLNNLATLCTSCHCKIEVITAIKKGRHSKAKLTEKDVKKIRELLKTGTDSIVPVKVTQAKIAKEYKVQTRTIRQLRNNRTWKWVK